MEITFKLYKKEALYRNKDLQKALRKMSFDCGELRPALEERRIKKVWVAFDNKKPIGWCGVYKDKWEAYYTNKLGVYVKYRYRKQGVGRKLLYLGCSRLRKYTWYDRSSYCNPWKNQYNSPKTDLKDKRALYGTVN